MRQLVLAVSVLALTAAAAGAQQEKNLPNALMNIEAADVKVRYLNFVWDEEAFTGRFAARAVGAQRRPSRRYLENLDAILRIQDHILELADRHDVPIVDNVSFDRSVLFVIRHVTEALRKREDFDAEALR